MALLFMDGFDHVGTSTTASGKKWDVNAVSALTATNARTGLSAQLLNGTALTKLIATPGGTFILGYGLRAPSLPASPNYLARFSEGATVHIEINTDASGFLTVKRGSTLLATATSNPLVVNTWAYLEIKVVIHDTAGSVACRVDGSPVTFNATLTGIDTRNSGTGLVDRIVLDGNGTSPFLMIDDLYLCDASGTTNNDFLGICVIETILPQTDLAGGAGDLHDFLPSTGLGTDHGATVDENPPNDDVDYNTGDTVGQQDSYNYPSLALTGVILGIQTNLYTRKTDVGARTVAGLLRVGGASYPGAAVSPTTSYKYFTEPRELNPATGLAWTSADIAALQVGMKIVS